VTLTGEILKPELIDLIEQKNLRELRAVLRELPAADIADTLAELEESDAAIAFRLLPRELAGEAFAELEYDKQQALIHALGTRGAQRMLEAMDPDDRVALLDELPDDVTRRLIASLSPDDRRITQQILGYPEDSVGRLMTPDYVRIMPDWTIAKAIAHIREYGRDAETVHWIFIVDDKRRLIDDLHIRKILLADPDAKVADLIDDRYISLKATDDQEEAVRIMNRYDRTALPVVDSLGRLLGIITYDDIADVAAEEATEDMQKLAGMEALDYPYMQTRFVEMLKKRGVWLSILAVVQIATIAVMGAFREQLESVFIVSLFVPLIIATGGNTGTQAASLMIRAFALDEISVKDWRKVLVKEISLGALLGLVVGLIGFLIALGVANFTENTPPPHHVGFAIGTAIVGIVLWGVMVGSMQPFVLKALKVDPATSSAPLVATLMDVTGLLIYFAVAITVLSSAFAG
jgi:magnesium transporter